MRTWVPLQGWKEKKIKASTSKLLERWLTWGPRRIRGGSLRVATLASPAMGHKTLGVSGPRVCVCVACGVRQN